MNTKKAVYLSENMTRIARRDRIFLNNPVIMQGMGLAPLVVAATTARNALMLSVAVILLLTPVRVIAALLARTGYYRFRGLIYCLTSATVYIGVYYALQAIFDVEILQLGIYLPLLVVEPLIIKRYERPQKERLVTALKKGLRTTCGYVLVLMLMGCLREVLTTATLFDHAIPRIPADLFPMASLPAGGFLLLGVVCAVWRSAVNRYKKYVNMEAKRGQ
ncbi:MAG: electron transporter RnfE [Oscillospiraceae bacterium]|uniref:Rnf-Nqr domain containing protein n=1 Tax=Candidatus Allofournierella excrementavium TaxID=2838591 RepID=UPI00374E88B7|nr:electron transporter RnfE [Oscillospiraceae bacterium]